MDADVTALAGETGMHCLQIELTIVNGVGAMTVEAGLRLVHADRTADGFIDGFWSEVFIAGGDFKSVNGGIVADAALIERAVALQYPGLRLCAHGPQDGDGKSLFAIADGVCAVTVFCNNRVDIFIFAKREVGMGSKNLIVRGKLHRVGHQRLRLRKGLFLMAGGAAGGLGFGT